ncbi:THUMP domain-containing class I SAM-dependent RNA methyltransferase [Caproiciproducens faecalis]|uniref:Class I SAM-dependent RNA methyltransferase n=1 Tax=Caproiciproducens faecalis TaxID=2820301 RepID=A0ABS7DQW2_9FIRM|nr:class I SAM-dependent RNA methyltransferase [Caproiciproducens faecalis]MBW7573686.1 class I SAM-dependent RNA methyltransferase [Caproiciproducens faecalis]
MDNFKLVCPCLLGVEGLVADELRAMDAQNVEPQNGRVIFDGSDEMLVRANLWSRYGERVLIQMASFRALSFEELFQGVKSLPWERWIGKNDRFPVKGRSLSSKLSSVPDCQSIIKKAIVERLKQKYHVSWFEETGPLFQIQFLIMKDSVSIMIDTSGEGLHKRGYRASSTEAPIKETLAACMVHLARVRHDANFIDPFCGSGTLLIEAAMYALNIAPGLQRHFSAERWDCIDKSLWQKEKMRAQGLVLRDAQFTAHGYDIDGAAVTLTLENAKKAGVISQIHAEKRGIGDFKAEGEYGCVICNPPYGERLLDMHQAEDLYRVMGSVFERRHGWSYSIISPDETFEECFGRKADRRRKLYNGMIKCQYYMYFK